MTRFEFPAAVRLLLRTLESKGLTVLTSYMWFGMPNEPPPASHVNLFWEGHLILHLSHHRQIRNVMLCRRPQNQRNFLENILIRPLAPQ